MTHETRRTLKPKDLKIIRLAFLAGALVLGVVGWMIAGEERAPALEEDTSELLRYAFFAFALVTLGLLELLRKRYRREENPARRVTHALIGYVLGDGLAILGFVFILLSGSFTPYFVGLLVLLLASLMFPPEDTSV